MSLFDIISILVGLAAVLGYLNRRWLRLPQTIGILVISLVGSLIVLLVDRAAPAWGIRPTLDRFLGEINFTTAMMRGMLCFLLFAGALHVRWEGLKKDGWTIGALATIGVVVSTAVVGFLSHALFGWFGLQVPLPVCLVFGALISPTDPIAVLGLLKELHAPEDLEAKIAGESLFNDGVGVVVFFALLSLAGLAGDAGSFSTAPGTPEIAVFFLRQVGGGVLLGMGLGYAAYRALKGVDHGPLELLMTLALAMITYSLSFPLRVSGPIAVVVAGIFIGNLGRRYVMSEDAVKLIEAFWGMIDDVLNAILFLLLGLQIFAIHWNAPTVLASLVMIPIVLFARFLSVVLSVAGLGRSGPAQPGLAPILTWGGLRGGLSVSMVLSLPAFADKNLLLSSTYAVVVFSIVVQGLSMPGLCAHYGLRRTRA